MSKNEDIIFVAEIGLNHNGNFGLLYELIKQASLANANIVKFQLGWRSSPNEINALTENDINHIFKCCDYYNIEPMFSIFNIDALKLVSEKKLKYFKVASRTLIDDMILVENIIKLNKTTFISLGMWDKNNFPFKKSKNIKYLWCKSKYPTYPWELKNFPKNFEKEGYYGYSDHSIGIDLPILAISRGAKLIEKHFTLDKSDTTIRDHALSATPDELKLLIDLGRSIRRNLNLGI